MNTLTVSLKRRIIIINLILIAFLCTGIDARTQNTDLPDRDISLKVLNKRGRPVRKIIAHSLHTGAGGITDRTGQFIFKDMADDDTISVNLPHYGNTLIPVAGMESIELMVDRAGSYSYQDNTGQSVVIKTNDASHPTTVLDVQAILEKNPNISSVSELLQFYGGSGIDVRGVGSPVGDGNVTIRGGSNTFRNSSSSPPLIVLNGMPVSSVMGIDVYQVKTIEVVKDGVGWGSRGANGAILINTR